MKRQQLFCGIAVIMLTCLSLAQAQESDFSTPALSLQRDPVYEQYLHFQSSADTGGISPARLLGWAKSIIGYSTADSQTNLEFQPLVRTYNSEKQVIGQFAFKF